MKINKVVGYSVIIILWISVVFGGKEPDNFTRICDGLKTKISEVTGYERFNVTLEGEFADLSTAISSEDSSLNRVALKATGIKIIYVPFRTLPFFRRKWQRKIYVKTRIEFANGAEMINFVLVDELSSPPENFENLNWNWCTGTVRKDLEFIRPSFVEPLLAVTGSLIVVFTVFYVRS